MGVSVNKVRSGLRRDARGCRPNAFRLLRGRVMATGDPTLYNATDDAKGSHAVGIGAMREERVAGQGVATVGEGGAVAAFKPQAALADC